MTKKYRSGILEFRTPTGIKKQLVFVTSGDNERKRLIEKGERIAKEKGWKLR